MRVIRIGLLLGVLATAAAAERPAVDATVSDWIGRYTMNHVGTIDQKFQHMAFYIQFPNNRQKFDGYLFSWDKKKMAGTTYWGGRTFGFYATKQ